MANMSSAVGLIRFYRGSKLVTLTEKEWKAINDTMNTLSYSDSGDLLESELNCYGFVLSGRWSLRTNLVDNLEQETAFSPMLKELGIDYADFFYTDVEQGNNEFNFECVRVKADGSGDVVFSLDAYSWADAESELLQIAGCAPDATSFEVYGDDYALEVGHVIEEQMYDIVDSYLISRFFKKDRNFEESDMEVLREAAGEGKLFHKMMELYELD